MRPKQQILWGTFILTAAGFLSRLMGFFYKIFLSHAIGAQELGIYQLVFPIQALSLSLTVSGMSTAISRFAAGKSAIHDQKGAHDLFLAGTGFSFLFTSLIAWFIHQNADMIASLFLQDPRTASLLRNVTWALPLAALHACVNAYFYSQKRTSLPALGQLLEQVVRISTACLAYLYLLSLGVTPSAWIAVIGIFTGELFSVIFALFIFMLHHRKEQISLFPVRTPLTHLGNLFTMYLPLTANRLITTFLTSIESILIPSRLILHGYSRAESLSIYGTLTGMALPLILFPNAITNSVCVMLLPSIAQLQALEQNKKIRQAVEITIQCCLLLGFSCTGFFAVFGGFLGRFLFHSSNAGLFIRTLAFVCPFLYLNAALNTILNGLGKTGICLFHSILGISLRLFCVIWVIPHQGIHGYLWGVLAGEVLITLLHLTALNRLITFDIHLFSPRTLYHYLRSR
mgnify:FL=1